MALLLVGLNHKTTAVELRERLHLHADEFFTVFTEMHRQVSSMQEGALISTCNRLEVYVVCSDARRARREINRYLAYHFQLDETALRAYLYIKEERAAADHLMHVACGLDSMILGEAQILGQVASALELASSAGSVGPVLRRLFESAVHAGKRARTETAISQHTTSVSHAAARLLFRLVDNAVPVIVVLGAGEMAEIAVKALQDERACHIHIVNRTLEHAEELAARIGASAHGWSSLWEQFAAADAVICATGAPHMVLYTHDIQRAVQGRDEHPVIVIDVSVPRNIDPAARHLAAVRLYDIDDLKAVVDTSIAHREASIPSVEAIIADEEERFWRWLNVRDVVPVIQNLRREVEHVVEDELHIALNKLGHLSDYEHDVVRKLAHRIMNKVLHAPTVALRERAAEGQAGDYAELVRDLFALHDEIV